MSVIWPSFTLGKLLLLLSFHGFGKISGSFTTVHPKPYLAILNDTSLHHGLDQVPVNSLHQPVSAIYNQ